MEVKDEFITFLGRCGCRRKTRDLLICFLFHCFSDMSHGIGPSCRDNAGTAEWLISDLGSRKWILNLDKFSNFRSAWVACRLRYLQVVEIYQAALVHIDWLVILEIMPAMVGIAASASLLMLLGITMLASMVVVIPSVGEFVCIKSA